MDRLRFIPNTPSLQEDGSIHVHTVVGLASSGEEWTGFDSKRPITCPDCLVKKSEHHEYLRKTTIQKYNLNEDWDF